MARRRELRDRSGCPCEALEKRVLLAGVTVITHGYQLVSDRPAWLDSMAAAIESSLGASVPVYALRVASDLSTTISAVDAARPTPSAADHRTGEVILLLDWAAASGVVWSYTSTEIIAKLAVDAVERAYPSIGIMRPLAELPIHLMGHSRGGTVVAEMSRLFAERGLIVHQQTTWDPTPALNDYKARVYSNTLFADNYYQASDVAFMFPPQGAIAGAHNTDLGAIGISHTGVHTYYHGTVDQVATSDGDGGLVKTQWYTGITGPRDQVGFAWSRIGGVERPAASGSKTDVPLVLPAEYLWDNVLVDPAPSVPSVVQGNAVALPVIYTDGNNDATIYIGFDTDANPYNGIGIIQQRTTAAIGGGSVGVWNASLNTSSLEPGDYYIFVAISNGSSVRYDYTTTTLRVMAPNRAPTGISLSKATIPEGAGANATVGTLSAVDPDVGDTFTYSLVSGSGSVDNAKFLITGNTLKAVASFDYETKQSYSIRVRVSDGSLHYEKAFAIGVTDRAETEFYFPGTAAADDMNVSVKGTTVRMTLNGSVVASRELALISRIHIRGFAGNDTITVSSDIWLPTLIYGDEGNDTINGGSGPDLIYGGDGDDLLAGWDGVDTIYGNFGNDTIMGGLKRDSLLGGLGADVITGGDGPDTILGGDGPDLLRGGKGADHIEGRGKADTIYGGSGNDTIYGNAGSDLIFGEEGDDVIYVDDGIIFRDTVYAGSGIDTVAFDAIDTVLEHEVSLLA